MNATFTHAVKYYITAECITPLRTGGESGDTQLLLTDCNGKYIIEGTSIAGAMRDWLDEITANNIFGYNDLGSSVIVSCAQFQNSSIKQIRPRLRMDNKTGTAKKSAKFDVAHILKGSKFDFCITWLGFEDTKEQIFSIEQILSALDSGEIQLGANKTNGFGKVKIYVKKQQFDMFNADDRNDWINDINKAQEFNLPKLENKKYIIFNLYGLADKILIKASNARYDSKQRITENIYENKKAILPASSIKGAVRNRVEHIAQLLNLDSDIVNNIFGCASNENNDNALKGSVIFEDAYLDDKPNKISRIRINKFTAGVIRQGLFIEEPLKSAINIKICVPEHDKMALALMIFALRDLALGLYTFGSGSATGKGYIKVDKVTANTPDGKTAELLFNNDDLTLNDNDNLFKDWLEVLKA